MSKAIEFLKDYEANNKLEGKLLFDYNLAKSSWLGVGGKAEVFYHCDSVIQLSDILKKLPKEFNRTVIGQGSNILIRDGGIKGLVIKLGKSFQKIQTSNEVVIAGGAAMDKVIARYSQEESIGGFEFLSGIPGNIGGAPIRAYLVTHGTISSVTGHGPTCGMRMLNFLFLQASQRRLKAARRPKSGVYRHPPSEFLLPPPP